MSANEKLLARRRTREAQRKKNEERARRDRANVVDAETIRAALHRVVAVDTWERKRFDQAAEIIRADAVKKRAGHFRGLQAAVEHMRVCGQTFAQIAELAGVDVREIQTALRRARTGDAGGRNSKTSSAASSDPIHATSPDAGSESADPLSEDADRRPSDERDGGAYNPTRCIRCDAVMLDADDAPRRGRRRVYCSDTCRRDASAARTAAERYGSPIRVVEVPRAGSCVEQTAKNALPESSTAITPLDAADITLRNDEALQMLLARVTEQARLKKLDRAAFTAVRELAKAVHPRRAW